MRWRICLVLCQQWIDGWSGLEGVSPKPRGFLRSAQSSPGHPIHQSMTDRALVSSRTLQIRAASHIRFEDPNVSAYQFAAGFVNPQDRQPDCWRPCEDNFAAVIRTVGTDIQNPVAAANDVGIVFDHHHTVAAVDQLPQMVHQACHIRRMQAAGGPTSGRPATPVCGRPAPTGMCRSMELSPT